MLDTVSLDEKDTHTMISIPKLTVAVQQKRAIKEPTKPAIHRTQIIAEMKLQQTRIVQVSYSKVQHNAEKNTSDPADKIDMLFDGIDTAIVQIP